MLSDNNGGLWCRHGKFEYMMSTQIQGKREEKKIFIKPIRKSVCKWTWKLSYRMGFFFCFVANGENLNWSRELHNFACGICKARCVSVHTQLLFFHDFHFTFSVAICFFLWQHIFLFKFTFTAMKTSITLDSSVWSLCEYAIKFLAQWSEKCDWYSFECVKRDRNVNFSTHVWKSFKIVKIAIYKLIIIIS